MALFTTADSRIVGVLAALSVFFQALTKHLNYNNLSEVHHSAANSMLKIQEDTQRLMTTLSAYEKATLDEKEEFNQKKKSAEERFNQAREGIDGNLPIEITAAFGLLEAELDNDNVYDDYFEAESERIQKFNLAYEVLFNVICNSWFWRLRIPPSHRSVQATLRKLDRLQKKRKSRDIKAAKTKGQTLPLHTHQHLSSTPMATPQSSPSLIRSVPRPIRSLDVAQLEQQQKQSDYHNGPAIPPMISAPPVETTAVAPSAAAPNAQDPKGNAPRTQTLSKVTTSSRTQQAQVMPLKTNERREREASRGPFPHSRKMAPMSADDRHRMAEIYPPGQEYNDAKGDDLEQRTSFFGDMMEDLEAETQQHNRDDVVAHNVPPPPSVRKEGPGKKSKTRSRSPKDKTRRTKTKKLSNTT